MALAEHEIPIVIALIESDATIEVPVRCMVALISYAMAGPTGDASIAARDRAVDEAERAMVAAHSGRPSGPAPS